MDKVKFDYSELKKFFPKLEKNLDKWIDTALEDYALYLEEKVVDEIDARNISVSGELKKSITHKVTDEVMGWMVWVGTNLRTETGYPYPVGVHEGTRPHAAPIDPLREWVRLKLNISNEKENRRVAWAIWWKIKQVGTKKNPFMSSVFAKEKRKINQEVGKALLRAMRGGKVV
jgi:hypothetical protein